MKVKELIEKLKEFNEERVVILSSDSEGNSYCKLFELSEGSYLEGEIGLEELTDELKEAGYDEDDVFEEGESAIILYP